MTTYCAIGSVRGHCGHHHRTPEAAARCVERDRRDCERAHGYSDRHIVDSDGVVWDHWADGGQIEVEARHDCR